VLLVRVLLSDDSEKEISHSTSENYDSLSDKKNLDKQKVVFL